MPPLCPAPNCSVQHEVCYAFPMFTPQQSPQPLRYCGIHPYLHTHHQPHREVATPSQVAPLSLKTANAFTPLRFGSLSFAPWNLPSCVSAWKNFYSPVKIQPPCFRGGFLHSPLHGAYPIYSCSFLPIHFSRDASDNPYLVTRSGSLLSLFFLS